MRLCTALFGLALTASASAQLAVTYGSSSVQTLSYNGASLVSAPSFRIAHMKTSDLNGVNLHGDGLDYGETGVTKSWNASTLTYTYTYAWGSIAAQFAQSGNNLNMAVTTQVNSGANVILLGAVIEPFNLAFPQMPIQASGSFGGYDQYATNTQKPSITTADFGSGVVSAVYANAAGGALYSGFENAGGQGNAYYPFISGTGTDQISGTSFATHFDRPVQPGHSDSYTLSLRFANEGSVASMTDAYQSWANAYPPTTTWTDKRIIGTTYLASSQPGNKLYATGSRHYFPNDNLDYSLPSNFPALQSRVLQQAHDIVTNAQRDGAQGTITWDIEGQDYPQETSYLCDPPHFAQYSPEMAKPVSGTGTVYDGLPLAKAYFKIQTDAGMKVGVCVRPEHLTAGTDNGGRATLYQAALSSNAAYVTELEGKISYAMQQWGATIFYIDSMVDETPDASGTPLGSTLDAAIIKKVHEDFPSVLLAPEQNYPLYYAYSQPFRTFLFHTDLGTDPEIYNYYPKAMSVNLVNDVAQSKLDQYRPQLTQSVVKGDILMVHTDYNAGPEVTVTQMYADAGATPTPAPTPAPPAPTPAPPAPPTIVSLAVTLSPAFIIAGQTTSTLSCTATYTDGSKQPCASPVYSSASQQFVTILGASARGVTAGSSAISATANGLISTNNPILAVTAAPTPVQRGATQFSGNLRRIGNLRRQ